MRDNHRREVLAGLRVAWVISEQQVKGSGVKVDLLSIFDISDTNIVM